MDRAGKTPIGKLTFNVSYPFPLNTASPFNIKVESLTLRNFNAAEVAELYAQHTAETGQVFTPEALEYAFYLTQG